MAEEKKEPDGCLPAMVVTMLFALVLAVLSTMGGMEIGRFTEQFKAIEAGVGQWEADPKTGKTHFVYKSK